MATISQESVATGAESRPANAPVTMFAKFLEMIRRNLKGKTTSPQTLEEANDANSDLSEIEGGLSTPLSGKDPVLAFRGEYPIIPFTPADVPEFESLLKSPLPPEIFGLEVGSSDRFIKSVMCRIRRTYRRYRCGRRDASTVDALTFYMAFLTGSFVDKVGDLIIVNGDKYQVWDVDGEMHKRYAKALAGLQKGFVIPAVGGYPLKEGVF
jgi:hypothetical protein